MNIVNNTSEGNSANASPIEYHIIMESGDNIILRTSLDIISFDIIRSIGTNVFRMKNEDILKNGILMENLISNHDTDDRDKRQPHGIEIYIKHDLIYSRTFSSPNFTYRTLNPEDDGRISEFLEFRL